MNNIIIRRINSNEVKDALKLALDVFMEFEAPVYAPEGIETLRKILLKTKITSKMLKMLFVRFMGHLIMTKW